MALDRAPFKESFNGPSKGSLIGPCKEPFNGHSKGSLIGPLLRNPSF